MPKPIYPQRADLVAAWIVQFQADHGTPEHDDTFWAFTMLNDIVTDFPDEAFSVILEILSRNSTPRFIPGLAAGPLENLLVRHGDYIFHKIEDEARRNPAFRKLLGGVWKNAMSEKLWSRLTLIWDRRGWDGIPEDGPEPPLLPRLGDA